MSPEWRPQPEDRFYDTAYVPEGDHDLSFYVAFSFAKAAFGLKAYEPEEVMFTASVLLDYRPVPEARMIMWDGARRRKLAEETASGFMVTPTDEVGIFEFVIPKEVFAEQRSYEVALDLNAFVPGTRADATSQSFRFEIHNGRHLRPRRPCSEPLLGAPYNGYERTMSESPYDGSRLMPVHVFPEDHPSPGRLFYSHEPLAASPGQKVRVFASFTGTKNMDDFDSYVMALMPMLDGVPLRERAFVVERPPELKGTWGDEIYWRGSFELTLPEEKGLHAFHVATWHGLYRRKDLSDVEFDVEVAFSLLRNNSNVLVFDVR